MAGGSPDDPPLSPGAAAPVPFPPEPAPLELSSTSVSVYPLKLSPLKASISWAWAAKPVEQAAMIKALIFFMSFVFLVV